MFIRLPSRCGDYSGEVVRLRRRLHCLGQVSRTWHSHLVEGMKALGFEQSGADTCVMRLMENGNISFVDVVQVDEIFAIGRKSRCDRVGEDLSKHAPIANLGEK